MTVKVPPLLHKMSQAAQKAWYKKHGMEMPAASKPAEEKGRSAAAAKKVKVEPRKVVKATSGSVRALNLARQQGYYEKGGRKPIGATGSAGASVMAGSNMSTVKGMIAGIKAGFNPKVSLNPYQGETEKDKKKKVAESNGEYNKYGQPRPGSMDIDPKAGDTPPKYTKKKPAQYKPQKEEAEQVSKVKLSDVLKATHGKKNKEEIIKSMLDKERASRPPVAKRKPEKSDHDSNDRGYGQGRYMGDSVELEGAAMNEVSKKEAEAVLGGPTKEKPKMPPGKQPAGYRYVRGLARKAMKAGLKEAKKPDASMAMTDQLKNKMITDKDKRTLGKVADLMAAQKKLDKKNMKEESEMQYIEEKLTAADPASKWISDFVKSDNPKFAGKSKKERIQQALGAYYAAKRGTNEEVEQVDEISEPYGTKKLRRQMAIDDRMAAREREEKEKARQAAQAAEKAKVKKEEVEQVDEISEPYGTKKLRRQMAIDDRMAARAAANPPFVEPEWLTKEKEKAKQAAEKAKVKKEEVEQVDEVTGYEGVKDRKDMIKRAAAMNRMGKGVFLSRVKTRAAEISKDMKAKESGKKEIAKITKEEVEQVEEKYMGFAAVKKAVAAKGARNPAAVAAYIGRKKYGKEKFQAMAAAGKKKAMKEGAEGKTPETDTEVELAKKHGDPKKITYGDVIKARIASAKKKALNKGE